MNKLMLVLLAFTSISSVSMASTWKCTSKQDNKIYLNVTIVDDGKYVDGKNVSTGTAKFGALRSIGELDLKVQGEDKVGFLMLSGELIGHDGATAEAHLMPDEYSAKKGQATVIGSEYLDCVGTFNFSYILDCEVSE